MKKYPKRLNIRSAIIFLTVEWSKRQKKVYGTIDPFSLGCQIANDIVPIIQNNYRRRVK